MLPSILYKFEELILVKGDVIKNKLPEIIYEDTNIGKNIFLN